MMRRLIVLGAMAVFLISSSGSLSASSGAPSLGPVLSVNVTNMAKGNSFGNILKCMNPVIDQEGRRLYFTGVKSTYVGVLDIDRDQIVETFDIGMPGGFLVFDDKSGRLFMLHLGVDRFFEIDLKDKAAKPVSSLPSGLSLPNRRSPVSFMDHIYIDTGYPFGVGYLQGENASYGVIEVRDPSGAVIKKIKHGPDALYFDIDRKTGRLYTTNTGDGSISVFNLRGDYRKLLDIDVGNSIDQILLDPEEKGIYIMNRLGGSTIFYYDLKTSSLSTIGNENSAGENGIGMWPTEMVYDRGRLYVLSHYGGRVDIIDVENQKVTGHIQFRFEFKPRTDALSTMVMDGKRGLLYAAMPEFGKVAVLDASAKTHLETLKLAHYTPGKDGPGRIVLGFDENLGRLFVYTPDSRTLAAYDGKTLELQASVSADAGRQRSLLVTNPQKGVLYLGNKIYDASTLKQVGEFSRGNRVVAFDNKSGKVYLSGSRPLKRFQIVEKVYEYHDGQLKSEWTLSPVPSIESSFSFDFRKGIFYVGYFETGVIEAYSLKSGQAPSKEDTGAGNKGPSQQGGGGGGRCGDSICQPIERQKGVCPEDCDGEPLTEINRSFSQPEGVGGRCGDSICQPIERQKGVCPEDCDGSAD